MGNYNLKAQIIRCDNCYSIRKMTISPSVPNSFINLECKCGESRETLQNFLFQLNKGSLYKIICYNCRKEFKNSSYCHDCNHIYCSTCLKAHLRHKNIPVSKVDYYCVFHQKELFTSYCHDCSINICKKCIEEKKHSNHNWVEFNKLMMNKNDKNYLKEKIRMAESKLEFTSQLASVFLKKSKKEEDKNTIINAEKNNLTQNKYILELVHFFIYIFDNSKHKNYNIIYNFIENTNLNVNKFKFSEKNVSIENAYQQILNYLKEDFIIIRSQRIDNDDREKKEVKRNKSLWELEEEDDDNNNKIMSCRTIVGSEFNSIGLKLGGNLYNEELNNYNEKLNKNSNKHQNLNNKKINNNQIEDIEEEEEDDVHDKDEAFYRPRSHAIFIPTKIIQKQIKEKNQQNLNNKNLENENEIENNNITEEKGEKKINEEIKNNEIKEEIVEIKEEEKNEGNKEGIKKEEKLDESEKKDIEIKVDFDGIKNNKYAKYIRINRSRNKTSSIINKMMINGFRNSKIYNLMLN